MNNNTTYCDTKHKKNHSNAKLDKKTKVTTPFAVVFFHFRRI